MAPRSIERVGLEAQRRGYRRRHLSLVPKWGELDHPHAVGVSDTWWSRIASISTHDAPVTNLIKTPRKHSRSSTLGR